MMIWNTIKVVEKFNSWCRPLSRKKVSEKMLLAVLFANSEGNILVERCNLKESMILLRVYKYFVWMLLKNPRHLSELFLWKSAESSLLLLTTAKSQGLLTSSLGFIITLVLLPPFHFMWSPIQSVCGSHKLNRRELWKVQDH